MSHRGLEPSLIYEWLTARCDRLHRCGDASPMPKVGSVSVISLPGLVIRGVNPRVWFQQNRQDMAPKHRKQAFLLEYVL